jgi:nucleotide-binding universal stress UspA family protein
VRNTSQPELKDLRYRAKNQAKSPAKLCGTGRAQLQIVAIAPDDDLERFTINQGITHMKILLAVDGSPCSDVAVEEIGRRPWPDGSSVKVLNAFELPLPATPEGWALPPNYFDELDQAVRTQAESIVKRASEKLRTMQNKTIKLESEVLAGPPRAVILDLAAGWGADLIVVGSHGYGRWERFLLGSVSQPVVSHAKCSVEVVRCPHANQTDKETNPSKEKK